MSRWFRYYTEALTDPKVQCLDGEVFKTWVNLLCIASNTGGKLPVIHELTYLLSCRSDKITRHVNELIKRGLLDLVDDHFQPHNWLSRQYKSDTSAPRTKAWRDRKCDVTQAVTVTPPDNRVQNTETDKINTPRAKRAEGDENFEKFWAVYPRRASASPKKPARQKFDAAVKRDIDPGRIISGAIAYAAEQEKLGNVGTQYVKTPEVWLNQEGWSAFDAEQKQGPPPGLDPIARRDWIRAQMEAESGKDERSGSGSGKVLGRGDGVRQKDDDGREKPGLVRGDTGNGEASECLGELLRGAARVLAQRA